MHRLRTILLLVIVLVSLGLLSGCAQPQAEAAGGLRPIPVSHVAIEVGVGSPIPVEIVASGQWPDLCAQLARATQEIDGSSITVELLATAEHAGCPPDFVGVPFRMAVPLNVVELPAGAYTVSVNGVSADLTWPPSP